jgi:hypothetical protein
MKYVIKVHNTFLQEERVGSVVVVGETGGSVLAEVVLRSAIVERYHGTWDQEEPLYRVGRVGFTPGSFFIIKRRILVVRNRRYLHVNQGLQRVRTFSDSIESMVIRLKIE